MTPDDSDHYGPGTPCSQCGNEIDEYSPEWTEYCHRHAEKRTTPLIDELEALADEWEEKSYNWDTDSPSWPQGLRNCTRDIRELLEAHNE